ncbi:hypothetical protein MC28_2973 [Bacillus thuringiensis MC28]|nr:hypothetical protein MC28_2973 [Bacillus thuringiensis MC28]
MVEYVDTGEEFTIDEKVNMDGSLRFKIHNSQRRNILYNDK